MSARPGSGLAAPIALAVALAAAAGPAPAQGGLAPPPPPCATPGARPAATAPRRLVVLPFRAPLPDSASSRLAAAAGDQLLRRLRAIRPGQVALRVARGPYTLDPMRLSAAELSAASRALGARYIARAELEPRGRALRLVVELHDAAEGERVWRREMTDTAGDVRALENRAALAIAEGALGGLTRAERAQLASRVTRSDAAYRHYLVGTWYLGEPGVLTLANGVRELETATRIDAEFAAARARLALAYALWLEEQVQAGRAPDRTVLAAAERAATEALKDDARAGEAWIARGILAEARSPRALAGAAEAYDRAVAVGAADAEAYGRLGRARMLTGAMGPARAALERSLALDPERWYTLTDLAELNARERRWDDACRVLDAAIAAEPWAADAYLLRAAVRLQRRDIRNAYADAETAARLGSVLAGEAAEALVTRASGDTLGARRRLVATMKRVGSRSLLTVRDARWLASAHAALGDRSAALAVMERAQPRGAALWWALGDPLLVSLRGDPRFRALAASAAPRSSERSN